MTGSSQTKTGGNTAIAPADLRVTIVTPSFNQASYIPITIESVLSQSHPNLEYIIMDGGSTDGTVDIIKKHSERLAYWQSKKDNGAADAINQGWKRASGNILSYLNSDDLLMPDAVKTVTEVFLEHPEADVVYGDAIFIDSQGNFLKERLSEPFVPEKVFTTWDDPVAQPAAFFRKELFERSGGLDESFHFCFDYEFWVRLYPSAKFLHIPKRLAAMRLHSESKTSMLEAVQATELLRIGNQNVDRLSSLSPKLSVDEITRALHLRASYHFRNSRARKAALESFSRYCWKTFPPWEAIYRIARFTAGMLLKDSRDVTS